MDATLGEFTVLSVPSLRKDLGRRDLFDSTRRNPKCGGNRSRHVGSSARRLTLLVRRTSALWCIHALMTMVVGNTSPAFHLMLRQPCRSNLLLLHPPLAAGRGWTERIIFFTVSFQTRLYCDLETFLFEHD